MITEKLKKRSAMKAELPFSVNVPFASHIARDTIKNHSGDFLRVFRVEGIAHESADEDDINVWHEQLNLLLRNIASPNLAAWTTIVRRAEKSYPPGQYAPGFAADLNAKYRDRCIAGATMLVNELYITLVYRPAANKAERLLSKLESVSKKALVEEQHAALEKLNELQETILKSLDRYSPEVLSTYEHRGHLYSELLEFFGFLTNGEWQRMPLPQGNLRRYIATSRPFFGSESMAFQTPEGTRYGAMLGIKEYPPVTGPGMLDELLSQPYEFILTQSFVFMTKEAARRMMQRQRDVMVNAGDLAESQIEQLEDALDDLVSNKFVFGTYHFSLLVLADSAKLLREHVGHARTVLSDTGMVVAREDIANEASFWAQLPGNFEFRPRPSPVHSRNFAGLSAFHNYPTGKRERNHWGEAVALMRTASGAPYYFNFHRRDTGNTLITGPTGSGKTVAQAFLLSQLQKFDPLAIFIDKDEGAKGYIKRSRGHYQSLKNGVPTGWNPLQMEPTPGNLAWIESWLRRLAQKRDGEGQAIPLSNADERDIAKAIAGVMGHPETGGGLPKPLRRLTQLLNFLNPTDPEGVYYRIQRWCAGYSLGWVFDSETDNLDFNHGKLFGFDMTELLDNDDVRTAALYYLMYRMEAVIDGRRFVCFMDEFWRLLLDDIFEDFAQDKLKVIRKLNGFLVFGTQSPKDTLQSRIAHTIVEQCPTQIFMPNGKAKREDYVDGFNLSEREYDIIRTMPEGSRQFLIKQGHNSVVAELDLSGFDDELAILSGTAANNALIDDIIAEVGDDPDVWGPIFNQRRVAA
jgi:type IV secretion system protein VirB4